MRKKNGFSLVEIGIVLTIGVIFTALLVGGVFLIVSAIASL